MHLEGALAATERVARQRIDLARRLVGHGIAAGRGAGAMHHEIGAGAAERPVIGVGKADIEREVIGRLRVHLAGGDRIEALRRLAVAFLDLRAELPGPFADRIGGEQLVGAGAGLLPDLELGAFLVGAHIDGRVDRHVELVHLVDELLRHRLHMLGAGIARFLAGGEQESRHDDENGTDEAAGQRLSQHEHPQGSSREPPRRRRFSPPASQRHETAGR